MTNRAGPWEHHRFDLGKAECAKVNQTWGRLGTNAPEPGSAVDSLGKAGSLLLGRLPRSYVLRGPPGSQEAFYARQVPALQGKARRHEAGIHLLRVYLQEGIFAEEGDNIQ